jgi:hypothetical protein
MTEAPTTQLVSVSLGLAGQQYARITVTHAGTAPPAAHRRARRLPLHDCAAWSAMARDTAGVLSALSQRVGGAEGIGLVKAAHSMSRAVVREPRSHVPASPHAVSLSQVARASLTVLAASPRAGQIGGGKGRQAVWLAPPLVSRLRPHC